MLLRTSSSLVVSVIVALGVLSGCSSASDDSTAAASDDLTQASSFIARSITPVDVPTNTPIGRSMDAVTSELAQGLTELAPQVRDGVTVRRWVGADGKEVFHRQTDTDPTRPDIIRVGYIGPSAYAAIYADHPKRSNDVGTPVLPRDGKVDGYDQETGDYSSVEDNDKDGKVDIQIFKAAPDTDLAPFGDWRLEEGVSLANRILEDTNHDGKFDEESLTAHQGWFVH